MPLQLAVALIKVGSFFQFRSFRTRLVVFILSLLVVVLAIVYLSVYRSTYTNTRSVIDTSLLAGRGIFQQLLDERTETLVVANRALSHDDAFRRAYFTREYSTILDLSISHLNRIRTADIMLIVNLDYEVEADTSRPGEFGYEVPWPFLIDEAEDSETYEATSVVLIDDTAYQILVVPLLSPDLRAWILIGRKLDDAFVAELKQLIISDVSILMLDELGKGRTLASTLNANQRQVLDEKLSYAEIESNEMSMINIENEEYVTLFHPLFENDSQRVVAVLQRSLNVAFEPYRALEFRLFMLFAIALLVSAFCAVLLGRSVTKPILILAKKVKQIEQGDYSANVQLEQKDELGQLADSVNAMATGLAEKEKVRDLLGKVVSPEIAEELLSKKITLGGEQKKVTILFSDIRDFTDLCENKSAEDVLTLLNRYLTAISSAIEKNKGVVDKYVGDAVMALYGAPVTHDDDIANALNSALDMQQALRQFNEENRVLGLPQLQDGIGIHTGLVVAGNLGSTNRMNYTVIGDSVNLAGRLEALTKKYGVNIIISEDSLLKNAGFIYRELDAVIVKGRQQTVKIFELIDKDENVQQETLDEIKLFEKMLSVYRQQKWDAAEEVLHELIASYSRQTLYLLYQERVQEFRRQAPIHNWDGSHVFTEK